MKSSNGSIPRRSNLSTQARTQEEDAFFAEYDGGGQLAGLWSLDFAVDEDLQPYLLEVNQVTKEANEYWIEFSSKLRRAGSRLYRRRFL